MDRRRQLYEELKQRPRNVRFDELTDLMKLWDYEQYLMAIGRTGLFVHKLFGVDWVGVTIPAEGEPVLETCVSDCFASIEDVIELEESDNVH